jgi:hypothetical protein
MTVGLPRYAATRYVLPLREGGSLPAIVDTDEPGQFVVKFRGAGQGPRALVAEVIGHGIARLLGLPVPDAAVIELADGFGMAEPNPEIQDLLRASVGTNFGLRYLSGAIGFDPIADVGRIDAPLASEIVWFDALITNVDRTARNPNILVCDGRPWLIDHGASLYFHHLPGDWPARSGESFPLVKEHVLLDRAASIKDADVRLMERVTDRGLERVVAAIPDEWLGAAPASERQAYLAYLLGRLKARESWLEEAERARRP